MIRLLASTALAALVLAACTPADPLPPAEAATVGTAVETAAEAVPGMETDMPGDFQLSYKLEAPNYTVTSEIDPAILAFDGVIAQYLWSEAKSSLDALGQQADEDKRAADDMAKETGEASWFMGYTLDFTYEAGAVLDDVIGVHDFVGTYTGGAHPNYFVGGANYRKGEIAALPLSTFIADEAGFHDLVVKGLVAQKIDRGAEISEATGIEAELRAILVPSDEVPDVYAGRFVLEKSTEPGKAGGISVHFSPYDVGSYAEGAYTVTLASAELVAVLSADWAGRFGGEPVLKTEEAASPE